MQSCFCLHHEGSVRLAHFATGVPFFSFFPYVKQFYCGCFFFSMRVGFSLAAQFSPDGNFSINTRFSTGVDSTVESMLGPVDL